MIRTALVMLLLALAVYCQASADELTIISRQKVTVIPLASEAQRTLATKYTPLADAFNSCVPLASSRTVPVLISIPAGATGRVLAQPINDQDSPMDYTGKVFRAFFLPANTKLAVPIDTDVIASPGVLDISIPSAQTLALDRAKGILLLKIREPHIGFETEITSISVPLEFYSTVTRLP